ncbi:Histidine kinase 3 [Camellia lanceoleosa]|uniref:Histidine kinase 3 n=1 Tax=Camellia lanceoleosa TaxID=1840588 RepID=A0ACC0HYK4_9ERIC|nr:Histidine kinase 3 [Camellia lanceoleosa]
MEHTWKELGIIDDGKTTTPAESCPFSWARSPENLLQRETYLALATPFVLLRLLYFLLPTLSACTRLGCRLHITNMSERIQATVACKIVQNVLRARESGKGVLTAPFRLLKSNCLGVILTFAVYKTDLPSNATSSERIQATDGYLGGVFDIKSNVEKLLQQLASKQTILVNVYDTTNFSHPISMYGLNVSNDRLQHVSTLNFGDLFRKHEMRCRMLQMLMDTDLDVTQQDYVESTGSGRALVSLINELLDQAKIESGKLELEIYRDI